jgi:hypothetical protein
MLARSGTWVPIAAGRCWHAGNADNPSAWPWVPNGDANGHLIGIEAESTGHGDWTAEQLDSYPRGVAALLAHMGAGPDRFLGHLEWAPSRKVDPAGWPGGMGAFRATLATQGDDMTPEQDQLLRDIDARLRGDTARPYDMLQSIQAIVDRIEQRLITDPGKGSDRLRDIWGEIQTDIAAVRADIAKLTPAKPA